MIYQERCRHRALAVLKLLLLQCLPLGASANVVINEIFYHAPNDYEDLQYVELHNSSSDSVDLGGWAFTKGIKFRFAPSTKLAPKGYLVLARNSERFKQFYDAPLTGSFTQHLSKSGERLQLVNASGEVVDSVRYTDMPPWPAGPDGYSASLERICPETSGESADNWASSPMSQDRSKPGGTPGKQNFSFSPVLPPVISGVKCAPQEPLPDQPLFVEAEVRHAEALGEVTLLYRIAVPGREDTETAIPMKQLSSGHFSAEIPGQAGDRLIRYRILATAKSGARRYFPLETAPRPALSSYVHGQVKPAKIPFGSIIDTTEAEWKAGQERARVSGFRGFGPRFFAPGPDGPPGQEGFAPDPNEAARAEARKLLTREMDLSRPWFELSLHQLDDVARLQKLGFVFITELSERRKIVDDILESPQIQEKLETLPIVIQKSQARLAESIKPILPVQQEQAIVELLTDQPKPAAAQPGRLFPDPVALSKDWVKLEGAWFAITVTANIDPTRFGKIRSLFQELEKERTVLSSDLGQIRDPLDGLRDLRERSEELNEKILKSAKPLLTPDQEKQLDEWRRGPELAANPPAGDPGPTGAGPFGGGPRIFRFGPRNDAGNIPRVASGRSAFVYFDPANGKWELFDFVEVVPRSSGQKIHFHKDEPFHQMTTINLTFEGEDAVLVEPLAYEVYRRAGVPAEQSHHVRLWLDGKPIGYQLLIEQPNRAFLRRNRIHDDGNLYKILWYEQGVVGQHEKKTRIYSGHGDIESLIDAINKAKGGELWEIIRKHFDVEEVANYFAVSMALSNWDGFFNNYFTYHDLGGTAKWTMFPWDEDQTWGVAMMMGGGQEEVFHTMPITFGMNGDRPPGQARGSEPGGFPNFGGGAPWWRQPGWFSGPLLANPQFRKVFLSQVKRVIETVYTEKVFLPIIDQMGERLKPEVRVRAELFGQDQGQALQDFERRLDRLREHLRKRRGFLLADKEVKMAN